MNVRKVLHGIKFFVFGATLLALFGAAVFYLWNALAAPLFGAPLLNYWQALGLLALARILVGGRGFGGGGFRRRIWHKQMEERFAQLSPEERERFLNVMGAGAHGGHHR
jgi:hypothetical protein